MYNKEEQTITGGNLQTDAALDSSGEYSMQPYRIYPVDDHPGTSHGEIPSTIMATAVSVVRSAVSTAASVVQSATAVLTNGQKTKKALVDRLLDEYLPHLLLMRNTEGKVHIADIRSPHIAYRVDGNGQSPLIQLLMLNWRERGNPAVSAAVQKNFANALLGYGVNAPTQEIYLRAAQVDNTIYIDTGRADRLVIKISPNKVEVADSAPVVFTRSSTTAETPLPDEAIADIWRLKQYLSVDDQDFLLVVNAIISTWFTCYPQAAFALLGPADSGKSSATSRLIDLIDPSTSKPGMSLPKNEGDFSAITGARRVLVFDNVSHISNEVSDLLARVTSGGEIARRALYTDADQHIVTFQRPVFLNGIMAGFSRGDLASRSITPTMHAITADKRIPSSTLDEMWRNDRDAIFSGLVYLTAEVLAMVEEIGDTGLDLRLADIQRNQKAVDRILGGNGEQRWREQLTAVSDYVLDANSVGMAVRAWVEESREALNGFNHDRMSIFDSHTLKQIDTKLRAHFGERLPRDYPSSTLKLRGQLMRLSGDLEKSLGVRIEKGPRAQNRTYVFTDLTRQDYR